MRHALVLFFVVVALVVSAPAAQADTVNDMFIIVSFDSTFFPDVDDDDDDGCDEGCGEYYGYYDDEPSVPDGMATVINFSSFLEGSIAGGFGVDSHGSTEEQITEGTEVDYGDGTFGSAGGSEQFAGHEFLFVGTVRDADETLHLVIGSPLGVAFAAIDDEFEASVIAGLSALGSIAGALEEDGGVATLPLSVIFDHLAAGGELSSVDIYEGIMGPSGFIPFETPLEFGADIADEVSAILGAFSPLAGILGTQSIGGTAGGGLGGTFVPEPSTTVLLALGAAFGLTRRRRRAA